jgi:hypothetical protein
MNNKEKLRNELRSLYIEICDIEKEIKLRGKGL